MAIDFRGDRFVFDGVGHSCDFNGSVIQLLVRKQVILRGGNRNDPHTDQHDSQYHYQEFLHLSFLLLPGAFCINGYSAP